MVTMQLSWLAGLPIAGGGCRPCCRRDGAARSIPVGATTSQGKTGFITDQTLAGLAGTATCSEQLGGCKCFPREALGFGWVVFFSLSSFLKWRCLFW